MTLTKALAAVGAVSVLLLFVEVIPGTRLLSAQEARQSVSGTWVGTSTNPDGTLSNSGPFVLEERGTSIRGTVAGTDFTINGIILDSRPAFKLIEFYAASPSFNRCRAVPGFVVTGLFKFDIRQQTLIGLFNGIGDTCGAFISRNDLHRQ